MLRIERKKKFRNFFRQMKQLNTLCTHFRQVHSKLLFLVLDCFRNSFQLWRGGTITRHAISYIDSHIISFQCKEKNLVIFHPFSPSHSNLGVLSPQFLSINKFSHQLTWAVSCVVLAVHMFIIVVKLCSNASVAKLCAFKPFHQTLI